MIQHLNTSKLLAFLCFFFAVGVLASCKKNNEEENNGLVQLINFGPTGAQHGDTLRIFGKNLNKVTAVQLTGATVEKSNFITQTAALITFLIPQETEQGLITLKAPEGDIVSKTILNLEVPVTVTAVTPSARPGDNITLTGTYLNWVTSVRFANDKVVDTFISKSLNELVVKVPMDAQTGRLVLFTGGTEPLEIETETALQVTLPAVTSLSPNPVERGTNLTINGTNLDLVKGVLFKGRPAADTVFVSQSATKLVLKVPADANRGKIEIVAFSGVKVESAEELKLVGDLPPLADFPFAIYTDGLQNGFQDWSWATRDFNSTANVRQGSKAIKVTYGAGGYEGITFHNDNGPATGAYTKLEFSVFGGPGTNGKKMNLVINGDWGKQYPLTLTEGEWKTFTFNLSDIGNPNPLKEVILQSAGWSGEAYVDHVGLR